MDGWILFVEALGYVAWPTVVLIALLVLQGPIRAFILDADEATWGKGKLKRSLERSSQLKWSASQGVDDATLEGVETTPDSEHQSSSYVYTNEELNDRNIDSKAFLKYYESVVRRRLDNSKYNTNTTSSRLGAEIIGNTYADLKQAIRIVAYFAGLATQRGRPPRTATLLAGLDIPNSLRDDIDTSRQFAKDVTNGDLKVNGEVAANYVDSVSSLLNRLLTSAADSTEISPEQPQHKSFN